MLTGESSSDLFYEYSQKCKSIVETIEKEKIENIIDTSLKFIPISPTIISYQGLSEVIIRSHVHKQYIAMGFPNYGIISKEQKETLNQFSLLYEKLVNNLLTHQQREYCEVVKKGHEEYLIFSNENYCFLCKYFTTPSLPSVYKLIQLVLKWLKLNEEFHFF